MGWSSRPWDGAVRVIRSSLRLPISLESLHSSHNLKSWQNGVMRDAAAAADPWGTFGFSIRLQVRHPRRSTEAVSNALGIRPTRAVIAGESRTTGAGAQLSGIYKESYCSLRICTGTGRALESRLRAATRRLQEHATLLRSWRRSGGTLAYYITIHGEAAMGLSLGPDLLSDIGRLGVELGIEALRTRQRP